ncbi:MAG: hypothetical protein LBH04_03080 [Tannerellaceae bacterium]|jgi:hypothetical protein|nr:hypothetical protein [Tannerellaceae bacterium]
MQFKIYSNNHSVSFILFSIYSTWFPDDLKKLQYTSIALRLHIMNKMSFPVRKIPGSPIERGAPSGKSEHQRGGGEGDTRKLLSLWRFRTGVFSIIVIYI